MAGGSGGAPYAPPPPAYGGLMGTGTSVFGLIIIGLLLLMISYIIRATVRLIDNGDVAEVVLTTAEILRPIGMVVVLVGLLQGALSGQGYTDKVRLGMFIAIGLIFAL